MFKLIKGVIKLGLFVAAVLILGNLVEWDGKSVSDQVRSQMAGIRKMRVGDAVSEKVQGLSGALKEKIGKVSIADSLDAAAQGVEEKSQDLIPDSEREKLKRLIHDLNSGR